MRTPPCSGDHGKTERAGFRKIHRLRSQALHKTNLGGDECIAHQADAGEGAPYTLCSLLNVKLGGVTVGEVVVTHKTTTIAKSATVSSESIETLSSREKGLKSLLT
jgi:hypothetical protein